VKPLNNGMVCTHTGHHLYNGHPCTFFSIRAVCIGSLWVRYNQKCRLLGILVFVEQDLVVHISTVLKHFLLPFSFNFTLCSNYLQ